MKSPAGNDLELEEGNREGLEDGGHDPGARGASQRNHRNPQHGDPEPDQGDRGEDPWSRGHQGPVL